MAEVIVSLSLSADKYLEYYRGSVSRVITYDTLGRRVQLPASVFRPFVTPQGIQGVFRVRFGPGNKFQNIERVA
ncbi:DUF2835 domain-containing protein [Oceanospirillum maris]|jgi:hypothetical protein|uniref:DUF2835 domain-containing protein n=1 Tax=Oceanospirillum maris TaxID=64977 RepID=UPI00041850ED